MQQNCAIALYANIVTAFWARVCFVENILFGVGVLDFQSE